MTSTICVKSTRHLPVKLVIASAFVFGAFVLPTVAADHRDDHRGGGHNDRGRSGGGYYRAPPVVYSGPGYYPPPVVYGPAVGIVLPGISIGIQ